MIEKISTPKGFTIPKKLKKLVINSVRRHAWNIGVSHYTGDILWMEEDKRNETGDSIIAECIVDRRYLKATIRLYPRIIRDWKIDGDQYVENAIAHEVAHIATQHAYDIATATYKDEGETKDAWETLTEVVARLSIKLDKELR
jgi:hypothetical protein